MITLITSPLFANDYKVVCSPWEGASQTFSLEADVELTGGNYIDAWVTMKVFDSGNEVQSTRSLFSFGAFFIDMLRDKQVLIFELRPAGGRAPAYEFLSIAANHPLPTGNSWLTFNGKQFQAECVTR